MRKLLLIACVILASWINGCSLEPKYVRPEAPVPPQWPEGPAYKKIKADANVPIATEIKWQEFFADENLKQIISMSLNNNRDLRIAALNVERAKGLYGIQRAELFPVIDASGSWARERVPGDLSSGGKASHAEQYRVDFGMAAWEIDFFGRIRSLEKSALKQYLATNEARRSTQISLVSEVANAYLTLAADQESLQIAQSTLESTQAAYDLFKRRYDIGLSQHLDLLQVQTRVDAAKVDISVYTRAVAQDESALNLLVGDTVPPELLPYALGSITEANDVYPGISSEVLLRRPDILQAENLLMSANANIGAARAALFPRISLTTTIGTASSELSGLFGSGSNTWLFSPQFVMPIFDPRAWSALTVTKTDQKIAVAQYEKTIQIAFKEVADSLAVKGTIEDQLNSQKSLVDAQAESYRLAKTRYLKGIDNYLVVIDAQRNLYSSQQGLVLIELAKFANQANLYAVLGGGGNSDYGD
jgi:multidrug efflux system outer membrane protein